MATKYLYGAAVQGIQDFIFRTNKLKEIMGASELVEDICTNLFAHHLYSDKKNNNGKTLKEQLQEDKNAIVFAAGNIKYIFENKTDCEKLAAKFPMVVAIYAPGITMSQAVVEYDDNPQAYASAVKILETRLKTQRNKPQRNLNIGLMGIQRCRQTGLPAVIQIDNEYYDEASFKKLYLHDFDNIACQDSNGKFKPRTSFSLCEKAFGDEKLSEKRIPYEVDKMTGDNNWVAVIHADGNGLGQIIMKIGSNPTKFKEFSQKLDAATINAFNQAYNEICPKNDNEIIPIRPIVLSGDDMTMICRADIAIPFTKAFLENFENGTQGIINEKDEIFTEGTVKDRLTACAGIAFVKSSYPFHYAYNMAETLCGEAKKNAKDSDSIKEGSELPQSCLLFHKVQSSFISNYDTILKQELTAADKVTSFQYGPYYLKDKEGYCTIDSFMQTVNTISNPDNSLASNIRNWLSLMYDNTSLAKQRANRILANINDNSSKNIFEKATKIVNNKCMAYDLMCIKSFNTLKTKQK